ncbi:hypothetical protein Rumeso_04245 [Rubellimicrobium mesophilum DSM 19309]|uniref:Uncharacterized protein n=1 Tax=Rubellimicrobium mesophilum DSM 19309 TaxID=442562 RepID=A0A017HJ64_9RHOB|nr:hypothetical protein [Rubellimicrobium mesophilum]EYD74188.1 hypothetical protein Rumeso_04245 [Rubellimicrobium mesophilum DSM 19309]
MARKAGPGDGAEDAPEGRADLTPEEGSRLSDARIAEVPEAGAGLHLSSPGEDARIEALSEEGLSALPPEEPRAGEAPSPDDQVSSSGPEGSSVFSGDWRQGGFGEARNQGIAGQAGPTTPEAGSGASDAQGFGGRDDSDPLGRTSPLDAADAAGSFAATPTAPERLGTAPPAPPPSRRRGGFGALLLGGMIAAALGFGAAWLAHDRLGLFPARLPADLEERLAALETRPTSDAEALGPRVAELETRLTSLEEAPAPTAGPAPAVDLEPLRQEVAQDIEEARTRAAELEQRIAALEARPAAPTGEEAPLGAIAPEAGPAVQAGPTTDPEALRQDIVGALEPRVAETEAGLADVRRALAEAQASLDALAGRLDQAETQSASAAEEAQAAAASLAEAQTRAATAETQARARTALGELEAAFDAGQSLEAPLADLAATGVTVPDALTQVAADGVPTLAELRDGFPDAARAALEAARGEGLLDDGGGVMGFLRNQLSVRSVSPRDGSDPDAVLSRAEAQLSEGHLDAALAEVDSLPEPVRAAMADWLAQAQTRAQAGAALADLRDTLPAPEAPPAD